MKKFSNIITEKKSMAYTNFFGKKISHQESIQKEIRDKVYYILAQERSISEKDFTNSDILSKEILEFFNTRPDLYLKADEYYQSNKRLELLAEEIYQEHFNEQ